MNKVQEAQKPQQAPSPPGAEQYPTRISVRIHNVHTDRNLLANASVDLNGVFAIRGIRVMQGEKGPFVSMPSYKIGDSYRDVCFPCTKQMGQLAQRHQEQSQQMAGPVQQQM